MADLTETHIAALDLGTSKTALMVAKVDGKDVQIVYYKETPSAGVKYSGVWNIVKATGPIKDLIQDAEEDLDIKITQVIVGMPKYPVRQESNSGKVMDRGEETEITAEDVASLKRFAQETYPLNDEKKEAIYGAVAQSFSNGEDFFQFIENEIIGMTGDTLEGHFKIFIGRKKELQNIDMAFKKAGITPKKKYFTAETTARAVLTESEMTNGVALIDFGGGSTSLTIYHGNIMRHYASIPFGGKNITDDIKSECQISDVLAENIKLAFGACMPERLQNLSEKVLHIRSNGADADKQLPVKYLSEIITARVEEIVYAILYEINESGMADMIRSGIVVTGGCAQIANIGNLITEFSGYKVRTGYPLPVISGQDVDGIRDTTAATSMGLILAAIEDGIGNCACADIDAAVKRNEETVREPAPAGQDIDAVQVSPEAESQSEPAAVQEKAKEVPGTLFKDEEIETVAPPPRQPRNIFNVLWGKAQKVGKKISDSTDTLIDGITEEEV
ncbi:MAG: cell division protein FtsA [Bacteroidales bacterium]|nr:cell division protein FtsA [Bacteroidales bacterium]